MKNTLAIVTANYNTYSLTRGLTESLKKNNQSYHVFISDVSEEKRNIDFGRQTSLLRVDNRGYANAINTGVKRAMGEGYTQLCVINNDVEVGPTFVSCVEKSLNSHPENIITGKIYYYPGNEYNEKKYNSNERGRVIWFAGGEIDWDNVYAKHIGVDEVDKGAYDRKRFTDFASGCLVCFTDRMYKKLGPWDEEYFMYFEDVDWCVRAKKNSGVNTLYDTSIVLWHKNAQSTGGSGSAKHVRWQKRSRFIFGMRYAPLKTKLHLLFEKIKLS